MIAHSRRRRGMTAIEVIASTMLSALLMTALIGVLRGLKAHEAALQRRQPDPAWRASLETALAVDLQHAQSCQWTPQTLTLIGHGGRNDAGQPTWLPSTVVYEVRRNDEVQALVRRETPASGGGLVVADNMVLVGVAEIRVSLATASDATSGSETPPPASVTADLPLPSDVAIEFWSSHGEILFRCRHRRL